MRNIVPLCLLFCAAMAHAGVRRDFSYTGFAELRAAPASIELPSPPPLEPGASAAGPDVIVDQLYLLETDKPALYGYAETRAQAEAAYAYWAAAFKASGVMLGKLEFNEGMFTLPYKTVDGRVIRSFTANSLQFPLGEAALRANMEATRAALTKAGLTPLVSRVVYTDALGATYLHLYLTRPESVPERETQLRLLTDSDPLDAGVLRSAGLEVIQTPEPWMMVYIGPEAGHVGLAAGSPERAEERLSERRETLRSAGKRIIGERVTHVDQGDYQYLVELYFVDGGPGTRAEATTAMATLCFLRRIEKDQCVYACRNGREYRTPVRLPEPGDRDTPVIACSQIVIPF